MSDFTVKIRNERQNLRNRIEWLEKGLKEFVDGEIFKDIDDNELIEFVKDISTAILDGEPTTADEFNESQQLEGIQLKEELESEYDNLNAEMEEGYDDVEKFREDHLTIIEEEE